ncbi:YceD family protein [Sphingomonas baiyangensis]|uniref:DUF177 domain-containing protein n=1 Tax=Sphingomonas baiyangensis TaxID=2572576 RepID=A0A4U1L7K6_9SPHN|nr:YceD family protein [Sphingomonas baiyangensis]TKD52929.1 DUF177 domain-containing protein [Sphingomonas baiyangensis]
MTASEFPRPHRLDRIGMGESDVAVEATPDERAALARRFALLALDRLEASYTLRREGDGVRAHGHLRAAATQACIATGDPVPATIEQDFVLRFVPEPGEALPDEVELDADDCDTMFFTGSAIDLGEAAAETLALALAPFPRSPAADAALREAGVLGEDQAGTGAFGALAGLRDKLAQ